MSQLSSYLLFLLGFAVVLVCSTQDAVKLKTSDRTGRDFTYHNQLDEDKRQHLAEYPPLTYQSYAVRDGPPGENCPPNPLIPMLGNGLNLLLLKLGMFGVVKAVIALIFVVFLVKIPLLLGKLLLFKTFLLPILAAPFIVYMSQMMPTSMMEMDDPKPVEETPPTGEAGQRSMGEIVSKSAFDSIRLLVTSDRCLERIVCEIGTQNNETFGDSVTRFLKYAQHSSPDGVKYRLKTVREAFKTGYQEGSCSELMYPCQSPRLLLSHGTDTVQVL